LFELKCYGHPRPLRAFATWSESSA
jgi:hypothetical protein